MRYLLDTDPVIGFLSGRPDEVALLGELADEGIALSIITYGEIYEGLLSPRSAARIPRLDELVAACDLLTLDTDVARHYGAIRSGLRSRGQLVPDNDLWIAATALRYELTLVSRDRHFARVPGLQLY